MDNTIVWADIPVTDLDRAMKFYGAVLQTKFAPVEGMGGIALEVPPEGMLRRRCDLTASRDTGPLRGTGGTRGGVCLAHPAPRAAGSVRR